MNSRLATRLRDAVKRTLQRNTPVFAGYAEALRHCPPGGYDSTAIAAVVAAKTERMIADPELCETSLPPAGRAGIALTSVIAQMLRGKGRSVRVLDFGGACGAHYFAARQLAPEVQFEWCVVETQAMIHQGRTKEDGSLKFAGSVSAAQELLSGVDLLHSSSTLQYLPAPELGLAELVDVGAAAMALTRLSLTDGEPFTVVQKSRLSHNGPGPLPPGFRDSRVAYPLTFLNRSRFETTLRQDYDIAAHYRDESSDHITPRGVIRGSSYLCLRKSGGRG
jgi:putative methyltransferase (TIGR04325 family)